MNETTRSLEIFLTVHGHDTKAMANAMEKLSTVATGLALDGLRVTISVDIEDDEYGDLD